MGTSRNLPPKTPFRRRTLHPKRDTFLDPLSSFSRCAGSPFPVQSPRDASRSLLWAVWATPDARGDRALARRCAGTPLWAHNPSGSETRYLWHAFIVRQVLIIRAYIVQG